MPKGPKIIIAAVLIVVGLASMGMIWLRDSSRRPEYCAECHIMEPYYSSWESSDYLAHEHAEFAIPCQTCHPRTISDSLGEIVTYARRGYETPLEEQEYPKEWCFQCHEHGSYEELIQRTEGLERNPHDSHYGEMECGICHKVHRASEDYCAQCHGPTVAGPGQATSVQPTTTEVVEWDPDMDCGVVCHVMQPYVDSLQDANLSAYAHAQEELVCLDCHELTVLQQVHEGADPDTIKLRGRRFSKESCFDCHLPNEHTSYQEIIELTKDYTVDDEKINPHDPHAGVEGSDQGQIECYYCHKMHKESRGINGCYGCHHSGTFENCSVCH